jgi:hypothetical protein
MNTEITRLRNDYRACLKLAAETDSKIDELYFKTEAAKSLEELRKICQHDFIVTLDRYYPSYSSYEEADPQKRICLICALEEQSYTRHFKLLTTNPISYFNGDCSLELKFPLNYLLEEVKEVALKHQENKK